MQHCKTFKDKFMNSTDINRMIAEKGNPCVSIILPTFKYTRARMQNPGVIEKAILKAKALLSQSAWPRTQVINLLLKLDLLLDRIDYMRMQEGLAVFISPGLFKIYLLPFTVKEKVMVGKTFEVRDLIYFSQFLKPYHLLTISKKRVRLFKGSGRDLQEIINHDFPKRYTEEYEYARPSIASPSSQGLKAFERDKSFMEDVRMKAFFRQADDTLNKYLKPEMPLFIAGVEEELVDFEQISDHAKNIAGRIPGNYDVDAVHPLAETAWKKIREDVIASNKEMLDKLEDNIGKQLATEGLTPVWRAAKEGRGLLLLLEKDYQETAYIESGNDAQLHLMPPVETYDIVADAADDVIEIVKEKGGEVMIVENGDLDKHQHIAMLLRYP